MRSDLYSTNATITRVNNEAAAKLDYEPYFTRLYGQAQPYDGAYDSLNTSKIVVANRDALKPDPLSAWSTARRHVEAVERKFVYRAQSCELAYVESSNRLSALADVAPDILREMTIAHDMALFSGRVGDVQVNQGALESPNVVIKPPRAIANGRALINTVAATLQEFTNSMRAAVDPSRVYFMLSEEFVSLLQDDLGGESVRKRLEELLGAPGPRGAWCVAPRFIMPQAGILAAYKPAIRGHLARTPQISSSAPDAYQNLVTIFSFQTAALDITREGALVWLPGKAA